MIRVVKLGGSLFDLPQLPARLRAWLAAQPPAHQVIVAGGGPLVEQVRSWHAGEAIDDEAAHWMCVDLLRVTARVLHAWLPEIPLVEDDRLLDSRIGKHGATILGPARWMRHAEPGLAGTRLPSSWETTSDSIAGRLAAALAADELVLLKSALPRTPVDLRALAAVGFVDPMMAQLSLELPPTRVVDLRADPPVEIWLPRPGGEPIV